MKITVERFDWTRQEPDIVVLVGDPYQNFSGAFDGELGNRLAQYAEGFASGRLTREISFALRHEQTGRLVDYMYFHTSLEKGFTSVENLKTFVSRALRLASDTGRKKVGVCLRGPDGEGLIEQLVEGAVVGTFKFTDFLKDSSDRFADVELILYPPTPPPPAPAVVQPAALSPGGVEEPALEQIPAMDEAPTVKQTPADEEAPAVKETSAVVAEAKEPFAGLEEPLSDSPQAASGLEGASPDPWPAPPEEQGEGSDAEPLAEGALGVGETAGEAQGSTEPPVEAPQTATAETAAADVAPEVAAPPALSEEEMAAWRSRDDAALQVGGAFGRGVNLARTMIAQPASVCTPTFLAKAGETIAKKYGFAYQAFGIKELEKQGFIGHVAVGSGSANAPKMFELSYEPPTPSNVHLVLVGKGVTFDTGGISIKPSDKMHLMVGDMSGAAAVLGAMDILGQLRPSIKVSAVVVSAENSPDGKSFRPGDILKYKNGVSVHVENTDGEGRLLLADGLIRAGELGATHIIDIATLTGACLRALGTSFTGVMGANRKLVNAITRAGGNHGESYWRLPLPVEYRSLLKTIHADLNNMGGPDAGATTAGLFLQEFVPPRTVWAHLDIAGTFWKSKPWKYYQEGPSGTGVKTLADLALRWHEHMG